MAATIKDIAKKLNLSVSTVSYALNNGPKPVSAEVRERVLEAARDLAYRPNRVARSLVTRRTNTIGIVPPRVHRDLLLSNFVQRAFNGIVNAAEDHRQDLMLFTAFDRSRTESAPEGVLDSRIDGLIIVAPNLSPRLIQTLEENRFPFATVADSQPHGTNCVAIDNNLGAEQVLQHLYDLGHRRIAHIAGPTDYADATSRRNAYVTFMRQRGIFRPEYLLTGDYWRERGYALGATLLGLPTPPTAIFAANDDSALGVYRAAEERKLRIPEDLSVAGFDDLEDSETAQPPLTTVRQPIEEMGYAAFCAVMSQIEGRPVPARLFPTTLVVRESTSAPRT